MQKRLTVSQLNQYISGVFDDEYVLHDVTVCGEIFELRQMGARTFLTLREGDCTLSCVSFASLGNLSAGMSVEALGSVGFYAKTGRVSFIVEEITPAGEGTFLAELLKLREKLRGEGLFEHRPALPEKISKIAVVTSERGAVLHDILSVVRAKNPSLDVCVYDVRVQGRESSSDIANALRLLNASRLGIDVIVIARGGGSAYDLQAYNTEEVARAVASSRIPVVSAVGHETDFTLCDLCASVRAGTPSIAADIVSEPLAQKAAKVRGLALLLEERLKAKFLGLHRRIAYRASGMIGHCDRMIRTYESKTERLTSAAFQALEKIADRQARKLQVLSAVLDKSSPLKVLAQGYAKISRDGKEIKDGKELKEGEIVTLIMRDVHRKAKVL